ncbi:MAG TPA: MBL fold metallo-hydrolase [Clostridia bacterium]|nr:MBL fold metallo-hydrolase [Clostridia bacterium]
MFNSRARNAVLIGIIALLLAGAAFLFIAFISLTFQPFRVTEKSFYHTDNGEMLVQEIFDAHSSPIEQISVHFLDVGNADCIFIDAGDIDILIDGGKDEDGPYIVEYLKELGTDDIELMIATHPHLDHVGGLDDVLEAFEVKAVIDSGISSSFGIYQDYMRAVEREGCLFLEDDDMKFDLAPGITFRIIETGDNYPNINDNSVVSQLTFGDVSFLFTGDMCRNAEVRSLNKFSEVDVLKVAHHGSRSSSCPAFLDRVNPKVAVMTCGPCERCGQNHGQNVDTIAELERRGIALYCTDRSGNIIITTDGSDYWIETSPRP